MTDKLSPSLTMRPDGSSRQVQTLGRTLLAWRWLERHNTFAQRYSTTVRSLNVWYHVAGVYNASARTLDIYVNGVLNNGTLSGTVPASQINSAVNVNIGRRSGGSGYYFNGVIDDVRIYNRALSQAEIQADMNTPVGSPHRLRHQHLHLPQRRRLQLHLRRHLPRQLHLLPHQPRPDGYSYGYVHTNSDADCHSYIYADGYRDSNAHTHTLLPRLHRHATPTATSTPTPTPTPQLHPTPTPTATATFTPTPTATATTPHRPRLQLPQLRLPLQLHPQLLQQHPLPRQLRPLRLVWWRRMDSTRGVGRLTDLSGNGNNGTISGATWTTGASMAMP